jgi:flavin-dependent dehydrogenase
MPRRLAFQGRAIIDRQEEPMAIEHEFDLVAIGGGFAGLATALRGAELGLRTAVVEQGAEDRYLCSSRWAGGIFSRLLP